MRFGMGVQTDECAQALGELRDLEPFPLSFSVQRRMLRRGRSEPGRDSSDQAKGTREMLSLKPEEDKLYIELNHG